MYKSAAAVQTQAGEAGEAMTRRDAARPPLRWQPAAAVVSASDGR